MNMMGSEPSDDRIIREFWNVTKKHRDIEDPLRKFIKLTSD